jgi:hypothetical protein
VNSAELNAAICLLESDEALQVKGGKAVPYIGWYWRQVDFDSPISFGDCGEFVGFLENNKWGYPEFTLTPEQDAEVKTGLRELVAAPTYGKCRAFWDRVQTFRPLDTPKPPHFPSLLEQLSGIGHGGVQ